jgi:hypothetical protein
MDAVLQIWKIQLKQLQISHEMPHTVPEDYMILISFAHTMVCGFFKLLFHRHEVLLARTQVTVFIILEKLDDFRQRLTVLPFNFTKNAMSFL